MEDVPAPWRMCHLHGGCAVSVGKAARPLGASSPRKTKVEAGVRPLGRMTGTCCPPRNGRPRIPRSRGAGDGASPGLMPETWGRLLPGPWVNTPRKKKLLRLGRNLVGRWAGVWGGVPRRRKVDVSLPLEAGLPGANVPNDVKMHSPQG